jgi:hypothetical protein
MRLSLLYDVVEHDGAAIIMVRFVVLPGAFGCIESVSLQW